MINEIFETLASNNSRLFKLDILQQHKDNEVLKQVIYLALDPFTQFYIRKIPTYTKTNGPVWDISEALSQLKVLSSRTLTGNAGIEHLTKVLSSLDEEDAQVIERIIAKDLKCGVSTATVNSVWPNFIHEYPCMLASGYDQKLVDKIKFPAYAQIKLDGMRFNAIVRSGEVEFRSRNGKELELLGFLEDEFRQMAGDVDVVFDGELTVVENGITLNRQTGNGVLNKASKGTISSKEASMVNATVWDVIPYLHFMEGVYENTYEKRFLHLQQCLVKVSSGKVNLVTNELVHTPEEANEVFARYYGVGEEGIILKDMYGIWENKRSKTQIKYKGELECDLVIKQVEEGKGKYQGKIGALLAESSDGVIKVSVGSGLSDEQRETFKPEELIGKVVAVKYNAKIVNKQGEQSLFLPIFLEVREDKTEADNSKDIK
jgi:ATP-dependent DNA ligase